MSVFFVLQFAAVSFQVSILGTAVLINIGICKTSKISLYCESMADGHYWKSKCIIADFNLKETILHFTIWYNYLLRPSRTQECKKSRTQECKKNAKNRLNL